MLIELGAARHRAGRALDALDALRSAADLARELGSAELLARAAIGYEAASWPMMRAQGAAELLEEAAAGLGERRSDLRVGLLSGMARALDLRGEQDARGDRSYARRSTSPGAQATGPGSRPR